MCPDYAGRHDRGCLAAARPGHLGGTQRGPDLHLFRGDVPGGPRPVDPFLAMTTVQNILGTRLANRMLEPIWNSTHIAEVDIVWEESLALEGRAGYYDGVGALKDMLQNHLLQLLCLVAMEPPISLGERDLRDRKLDVLRSVRPLPDSGVVRRTRRARYLAGRIGDQQVPPTWTRKA